MAAREIRAAVTRQKRHREDLAWLAWHTAILTRMDHKGFPTFEKFRGGGASRRRSQRTWQEMAAEMAAFAESMNDNRGKQDGR